MHEKLSAYFNAPIPRKTVLTMIVSQGIAHFVVTRMGVKRIVAEGNAIIADAEQRVAILQETTDFLLERADDATAVELNEKLDYWRVVRGVNTDD